MNGLEWEVSDLSRTGRTQKRSIDGALERVQGAMSRACNVFIVMIMCPMCSCLFNWAH